MKMRLDALHDDGRHNHPELDAEPEREQQAPVESRPQLLDATARHRRSIIARTPDGRAATCTWSAS